MLAVGVSRIRGDGRIRPTRILRRRAPRPSLVEWKNIDRTRGYPAVHLGVAEVKHNGRLIVRGGGRARRVIRGGGWIPSSSRTGSLAGYPWSRWPTLSDSGDPRAWHHYPWMLQSANAIRSYFVAGAFVVRSFDTATFSSRAFASSSPGFSFRSYLSINHLTIQATYSYSINLRTWQCTNL